MRQVQLTIALNRVLPEIMPCDVTALLLHLDRGASLVMEALVSFLKIPSAIKGFLEQVPTKGCTGAQLATGILAAATIGRSDAPGVKAAGAQVHRQRQGAIMGPTVLATKLVGSETTVNNKLSKYLAGFLERVAAEKALAVPSWSHASHMAKYRKWLTNFCDELGVSSNADRYVFLHLLRKHCIRQIFLEGVRKLPKPPITSEAITTYLANGFSSRALLPASCTVKQLKELVPDEGMYLSKLPAKVRPSHVAHWAGGTDMLFLSCWFCLSKELLDHAMCRKDSERPTFSKPWTVQEIVEFVEQNKEELIAAAREHAKVVDAGVAVPPCVFNLLKGPLLAVTPW